MKKYLTIVAAGLLLVSTPSFANNAQMINIVKKINAAYTSEDRSSLSDTEVISRYADNDLKRWIRLGSSAYGRCHDGDVRIQAQDWCNITFTYGISLKDHVNVEVTDRCMNTITKDNL